MCIDKSITKRVVIDHGHSLTRIAVQEGDKLTHLYMDSVLAESVQDRIVVGQVDQVVKNLQGAFIDFGESKNGLLHFKQVPDCYKNKLQQGARIPVQVKKENTGDKGHKLTCYLNIQGYYLVCMVFEPEVRLSKKIKDPTKRQTLKKTLEAISDGTCGFLVRTKAEHVPLEVIEREAVYLREVANKILSTKDNLSKGMVLLKEDNLALQVIMDHLKKDDQLEISCNHAVLLASIKERLTSLVLETECLSFKSYPENENLFKIYNFEKRFDNAMKQKVWLKNGGNIVIDYTEAMTVIDVNSAKAIVSKNQEKTVWELNACATEEALFQMMHRNLSGMVLVDLVEFKKEEQKALIFEHAKKLIAAYDRDRTKVYPLTELGLLQFVRTKKYTTLPEVLSESCTACKKRHSTASAVTSWHQIENQLKQMSAHTIQEKIYLYCDPQLKTFFDVFNWEKAFKEDYGVTLIVEANKKFDKNSYELKYHPTEKLDRRK
ncbi:MAG: ribonuclease E/G [Cellulosilyticaceae bacterium]